MCLYLKKKDNGLTEQKKLLHPAISGYVFFKLEKADYSFINLNPFLRNVVRRFGQAVEIHGSEIQTMKDCLNTTLKTFLLTLATRLKFCPVS
jgi:hypothetical protein